MGFESYIIRTNIGVLGRLIPIPIVIHPAFDHDRCNLSMELKTVDTSADRKYLVIAIHIEKVNLGCHS